MLQRRVKLGYSRAARIVDQMEELGVVGPYEGAKPRAVVIDREGWQALQVRLGMADESELALAAQMNLGNDLPDYDE
jgi:S-DNA-T family DNA segregation ATPase FtsK/SpoIIIE